MTVDLTAANDLPPRADELFRIFARFEFALKMAGYARMSGKMVKILWDEFATSNSIGTSFFDEVSASGICPSLLTAPPKADRISNGQYGFDDQAQNPTTPIDLFQIVRRVRNNVFHGGKYFDRDAKRDELLIAEAIAVLLLACERHDDVKFYFEGRA